MPKHVRSDMLSSERRATLAGHGYMFGQQIRDTIRTEAAAAPRGKKHFRAVLGWFPQPRFENRHGGFGQRRTPLFVTLAYAADVRSPAQNHVGSL